MNIDFLKVCSDVTKTARKIPQSQYLSSGQYPIFDQGQKTISGYYNDVGNIANDFPYIVFGDHTRVLKYVNEPCYIGADGVKLLKIINNDFVPKYVFYALLANPVNSQGYSRHFKFLKEKKIKIASKKEQHFIIEKLDSIKESIELKENELKSLDELVKSRFIEMFMNKAYQKEYLKNLSISKAEYGAGSASIPYVEGRPRYVRITDIKDDGTLNNDLVCSANSQDDINYKLSYGDFMFARMGATVGKTYAYFEGNQIYAGYLIRYRLNTNKINPRYLFFYTKLDEYWLWVKNSQSGAAQPGINAKKYDLLQFPVPPIKLQNEFAAFVEQVDKSKFVVQQQIKDLQELLDKKMDEYFSE